MLRNNALARRCSYFELGLPVVPPNQNFLHQEAMRLLCSFLVNNSVFGSSCLDSVQNAGEIFSWTQMPGYNIDILNKVFPCVLCMCDFTSIYNFIPVLRKFIRSLTKSSHRKITDSNCPEWRCMISTSQLKKNMKTETSEELYELMKSTKRIQ